MKDNTPIKVWFADMWHGFDPYNNMFSTSLSRRFNIEVNPNPDFLIHSIYGKEHLKYHCCKIGFTGDNTRPDFERSDYHIGFDFNDDSRYLRWPIFLAYGIKIDALIAPKDMGAAYAKKDRFCSFVVSNPHAEERIRFFQMLNAYKQVDSGGGYLNNIGGPVRNKKEFLSTRKFNIAFENSSYPGYTSEKIYEAFLSNTVPIYWGNPRIAEDFNPDAFINMHDFSSFEDAIDYVRHLDHDDAAYRKMLEAPAFRDNLIPDAFKDEVYYRFFEKIFMQGHLKKPLSKHISHWMEYAGFNLRRRVAKIKNRFVWRK